MKSKPVWIMSVVAAISVYGVSMAKAQTQAAPEVTAQEVAEMMSDPAAKLIFFNASYRAYMDVGPSDDTIQELRLNGAGFLTLPNKSVLLYRAYLPFYSTDVPVDDKGVGDALLSAYWAPGAGNFVLGYGGALLMPTASEDYFGLDKWSAGPTLVIAQKVPGKCTFGGLLTHVWSFAGNDKREDVSLSTIQPAVVYFLNQMGTSLTWTSETTYDWKAERDHWQVPMTLLLEQVLPPVGATFFAVAVGGTYYVEKADYAQDWDIRGTVSLVIP
jgi:hypothetical protein